MSIQSTRTSNVDTTLNASAAYLIPLSKIRIAPDHRKHAPAAVQAMSENIAVHGQRQPIEVVIEDDGYRLIFGRLRMDAVALLDRSEVQAFVKRADEFSSDATMRLVSISENMLRRELTVLEKSVAISDWCAIYRAAQPVMKPGPKPSKGADTEFSANLALNSADALLLNASASFSATFSDAAQAFLDVSRRGVFRALKIASIDALQRDRIAFHPVADNQSELTALADQSVERQGSIIGLIISGKAANIAGAIALLDQRPMVTQAVWERFSQKFARMAEPEQDRFFELNQAAISRWYATRGGK